MNEITSCDRLDPTGSKCLRWAHLPRPDLDREQAMAERVCR